jgi:hypothetical protein
MKRNRKRRYAVAALLAFIVATSSFAFAASNTVGASSAGIGTGTIGGYTATNIKWTLNATDPSAVASVRFDLSAAATDVRARVRQGATPLGTAPGWSTCTVVTANTFNCVFPGTVSTLSADTLEIAAAS